MLYFQLPDLGRMLLLLSAVAGAVHVLAPDHWVPASVLSWQRRWRSPITIPFLFGAYLLHVAGGFLLYKILFSFIKDISSSDLLIFALILITGSTLVRARRFTRWPKNRWAILSVLSLLGPCESLVPVFMKSNQLGFGYLLPLTGFFAGSFFSGTFLVIFGRQIWNRPLWFPRGMEWAQQKMAAVPVVFGLALGLSFLLRLSS